MESNVNTYKLNQSNKEYFLKSSIVGNRLRLSCKNTSNKSIKFSRDFTVDDLKQLDKVFNAIETPLQALEYIDNALRVQKVAVSEDSNSIKINFILDLDEDAHQMQFPLKEEAITTTTDTTTTNAFNLEQNYDFNQNNEIIGQTTNYDYNDISSYNQTDLTNELVSTTNIENYDTTAFQQTDTQYTGVIDNTNYQTTYETSTTADNYLQNLDVTNTVDTTGFDLSKYETTQDVTNQYIDTNQFQDITSTTYNEYTSSQPITTPVENYQTYETTQNYENYEQYTTNIPSTSFDSTPYITPVDDNISNQIYQTANVTTTTETNIDNNSNERINKLEGDTNNLRNEHQEIQNKLNSLTGQLNEYQYKLTSMEQNKSQSELEALKAENQLIKQQLQELNSLRRDANEARLLRSQLSELDPLRRKAAETDVLRAQLSELNSLREKVAELSSVKSQLNDINNLKMQMNQYGMREQMDQMNNFKKEFEEINALKQQLKEMNDLKNKQAENDTLKQRIQELENLKIQYEQEIKSLRESSIEKTEITKKLEHSTGMESKQLLFEEKPEQICVKGDIIQNTDELELLTRKINKYNQKITLNLLYKATADSDKAEAFHAKCDEAKSTLVLIETDKGKRFGGYTTCSWAGECEEKKDSDAFVFSLDKMMIYENIPSEDAIGCYPKFGPIFLGCQIRIYDNAFTKGGTTFEKRLNYNTEEDYELTEGDRIFDVKEIEVYEVITE